MANRWYVNRAGQVNGPFPAGALQQDRLVGRIADTDPVSPDLAEWKPFAEWPELAAALHPDQQQADAKSADEKSWLAERNHAKLRWADQRSGEDRREDAQGSPPIVSDLRDARDRRNLQTEPPIPRVQRTRSPGLFGTELSMRRLLAGLLALAGVIGLLIYLFGPVNPVPVRIF